ncbi:Amidohydrolase family protein [uncultured Pleomorphomonas sp.]|uniref:Amidohydrolase family protein n=1 Tax=uncultured Pleomorphomonas sp. TaxID=442121 RepID=A0A212L1G5_9HYPH|nr:amidohydrolase family protein [uncultured Pleomorphomonas sp.]SCM71401.1 Amidohydrolase family protein [uncultured Pleomorphomonas sp.]
MIESMEPAVIKAGRLIDGTGGKVQEDVGILVLKGRIAAIGHRDAIEAPADARVIDLGRRTLLPGMVDAHMHFFGVPSHELHKLPTEREAYRVLRAAGEAKKMLEAGITAARCLGSSVGPDLCRAINEGHVPGPRIMAAGEFICSTDGTWDHIALPIDWARSLDMIADGVENLRAIVRRRVRRGAQVIKVGLSKGHHHHHNHAWGDDPHDEVAAFSLEEVRALVDEAHLNQLKVSAHCIGDEAVRNALDGGVDVIEHGYGITEDTRRRLVDENALLVSTICQLYYHEEAFDPYHYPQHEREVYRRHIAQMREDFQKSLSLGVRYALGTDLIGFPTHPQNAAAREFEFAVEWGMGAMQAIVSGTAVSAEAMGLQKDIGTVETGKLADMIAVDRDPLADITELQRVRFVMLGGNVVVDKTKSILLN